MVLRSHQVMGAIGAATLLLVALAGSGILPLGVPNHAAPPSPISVETSNNFDQLVVVLMENRNLNEVYGPATYMTQLAIQASPWATEQECMLLQSFGVSQMKFVPALKAEITSFEEPGSRLAHREAFPVIVVKERNGKWSSPRGGFRPQPVPLASSANAFHVLLVFSMISTIVG